MPPGGNKGTIMKTFKGFSLAVLTLLALPTQAQDDLVRQAFAGVADIGKQWNGQVNTATQALYTPLHQAVDQAGLVLHEDIAYGPDPLQTFDLWVSEAPFREGGPVLVYFHGGGLTGGDKVSAATNNLIYSNVGKFAARMGGVGINANYRLAPAVKFPAGAEDLREIIRWIKANVAEYGGDPDNIFLMGNSAGATHVASYLYHEPSQLPEGPGIRAAILSSCGCAGGGAAYYGEDAAVREATSPLALAKSYAGQPVPVYLWSAQYDPSNIEASVADLYATLCHKYEDCPLYTQWQGYNHVSHVMSIDTADTTITNGLIRFYHQLIGD
jgi:acetyl esterase